MYSGGEKPKNGQPDGPKGLRQDLFLLKRERTMLF